MSTGAQTSRIHPPTTNFSKVTAFESENVSDAAECCMRGKLQSTQGRSLARFNKYHYSSACREPSKQTLITYESPPSLRLFFLFLYSYLLSEKKIKTKRSVLHPQPSICHLHQTSITAKWQLPPSRSQKLLTPDATLPDEQSTDRTAPETNSRTVTQWAVTFQQLFFPALFSELNHPTHL